MPSKRNRNLVVLLGVLLGLVLLLGCGSFSFNTQRSSSRSVATVTDDTDLKVLTYDVRAGLDTVELSMDVKGTAGMLTWEVVDPHGEVLWSGEVGAGERVQETRSFAPAEGTWTLTLDMAAFSGRYRVDWRGR